MPFFEPYIILTILIVTMVLFIWGRWRYDVVALLALMCSVLLGAVPFKQVYIGLANPAVITVACVMVISQAITQSGLLDRLVRNFTEYTRLPILHVLSLSLITAILSAFMNNIGALALMMPIAIQTALKNKRSPTMILMPIALASALGGLCTVIGTPPNLLISNYRLQYTGQPFAMFDFGEVGIFVAVAGIIFIAFVGWRLLPKNRKSLSRPEDLFQIQEYITEIKIPKDSEFDGKTVQELETKLKADFFLVGLIRNKRKKLVLSPEQQLQTNDILIIETSPDELQGILQMSGFELVADKDVKSDILKTDEVSLLEAVVPQGSILDGRSSKNLRLRSRHKINLLAISREGKSFRQRLKEVALRAGDVVLLQGATESLAETIARLGFLPLAARGLVVGKKPRAYLPLVFFGIAILLSTFQLIPVEVSFGGAVLFMVLFKVMPIRRVYESIEWSIIILLAAMIPIGNALQTTGGTALITHYFIAISSQVSPIYILGLLLIITMTLSDFMNNAATTVVMAPIAVSIAHALKVNIDPFLMTVALGASCSFLTPVGHQNNTLVMGPGGYKFSDYIRLGLPLEIIVIAVGLPLLLWAWPLR